MSSEKYIPSKEEIKKAEDSMGVEERVMSEMREKNIQDAKNKYGISFEIYKGVSYNLDTNEFTINGHKVSGNWNPSYIQNYKSELEQIKAGKPTYEELGLDMKPPYVAIDGVTVTDLARVEAFANKYYDITDEALKRHIPGHDLHVAQQQIYRSPELRAELDAENEEKALRSLDGLL